MNHSFLLTVIIPTRNRQKYAIKCVEYIMSLKQSIQIIVCDNSDNNDLEKDIQKYTNNSYLKYLFIPQRIACIDNYEKAASLAEGEYFCAIGDDDTVLPNIVDVALWMKRNNVDAVKSNVFLNYWWPQDKASFFDRRRRGCVWCNKLNSGVKKIDTFQGVITLLQNGCQDYLSLDLVRSYHGIVKTSRLIEAKKQSGRFYGGCSPDIYSAVSLSLLPDMRCFEIGIPFSLPGVCSQSTSADSERGKHTGELESAPQFVGMSKPYDWMDIIPRYYTVQTIWAETALKSIKNMGFDWMISKYFNKKRLVEEMIVKNPHHKNEIESLVMDENLHICLNNDVSIKKSNNISKKIKRLLNVLNGYILIKINCISIEKAASFVVRFLNKKKNKLAVKKTLSTKV